MSQRDWQERDRRVLWHPFTQHQLWEKEDFPVIVRGEGVYLYDLEGRKYLDGVSSLWVSAHGHNHPRLNQALKDQLVQIAHSTFLGLSHPRAIELGEKLVEISPAPLSRVFYAENGASAVEIALKMAFQYWKQRGEEKRSKFLCLTSAYHGDTIGAMSLGGVELFMGIYQPLLFPVIRSPAPYCYRCPLGREGCKPGEWECFSVLEQKAQDHQKELVGIFLEPVVQCAGGMLVHPPGFLKKLEQLSRRLGIFLLLDEVAVGLGRLGKMFACELEGVEPDFLILGKALGAGYLPLSCVLTTEEVFSAFLGEHHSQRTFFHGHTYTANPLACAVGLCSLELFDQEVRLENVQAREKQMKEWWKEFERLEIVGEIRHKGLLAGMELVKDKASREEFPPQEMVGFQLTRLARNRGVILRPLGNVAVLMPPLIISENELDQLMEITLESLKELEGKIL